MHSLQDVRSDGTMPHLIVPPHTCLRLHIINNAMGDECTNALQAAFRLAVGNGLRVVCRSDPIPCLPPAGIRCGSASRDCALSALAAADN